MSALSERSEHTERTCYCNCHLHLPSAIIVDKVVTVHSSQFTVHSNGSGYGRLIYVEQRVECISCRLIALKALSALSALRLDGIKGYPLHCVIFSPHLIFIYPICSPHDSLPQVFLKLSRILYSVTRLPCVSVLIPMLRRSRARDKILNMHI